MDTWHPMEKAQFPDYFTKRVELKKAHIDWYIKKYGITQFNPEVEGHVHELDEHHDDDDHHHHHHEGDAHKKENNKHH